MKKLISLLLLVSIVVLSLLLVSCEYQDTVDSARSNLMDTAKDLLDPFLNQAGSSTNQDDDNSDAQKSIQSSENTQSSEDIQ